MKYRKEIMDICIKLSLPLTVRSTSIQIFDKTVDKMLKDENVMIDLVYAIVILASKCEEIHGDINALMKSLPGSNKENIFKYESEMFEALDYSFHFPSLYLRMYGVLAILQEKELIKVTGGDFDLRSPPEEEIHAEPFIYIEKKCTVPCIDYLWISSVQMMDRMLLLDKAKYKEIELVYASLQFPCEIFDTLTFTFDKNNVIELRSICKDFLTLQNETENSICT